MRGWLPCHYGQSADAPARLKKKVKAENGAAKEHQAALEKRRQVSEHSSDVEGIR